MPHVDISFWIIFLRSTQSCLFLILSPGTFISLLFFLYFVLFFLFQKTGRVLVLLRISSCHLTQSEMPSIFLFFLLLGFGFSESELEACISSTALSVLNSSPERKACHSSISFLVVSLSQWFVICLNIFDYSNCASVLV